MLPPHPSLSKRNWFSVRILDDGTLWVTAYKGDTFRYNLRATRHQFDALGPTLARSVGPVIYDTRPR